MATTKLVKLSELKVAELKSELEERELDTSGNKSQLQERLRAAILQEGSDPDSPLFESSRGSADLGKLLEEIKANSKALEDIKAGSKSLEEKFSDNSKALAELKENSKALEEKLLENSKSLEEKLDEKLEAKFSENSKSLEEKLESKFSENSGALEELKENSKALEEKLLENSKLLEEKFLTRTKVLEEKLEQENLLVKQDVEKVKSELIKRLEEANKRIEVLESSKLITDETETNMHTSLKSDYTAEITGPVPGVPAVPGHSSLPPFDGKMPWEEYLTLFETAARVHQWSAATKASVLSLSLRGDALGVLQAIPAADRLNYDELVKRLEMRFGHRHMEQVYRSQLRGRFQKPNETLQEFEADIARLVRSAYPTVPDEVCESLSIDRFLDGLRETETQQAVKLARPKTLSEALTQALEFEAVKQSIRGQARVRATNVECAEPQWTLEDLVQKVVEALKSRRKELRCWGCGELGHPRSRCKSRRPTQQTQSSQEN